jgi:putative colanic acid biosynthesis acetyltransferase WcaF
MNVDLSKYKDNLGLKNRLQRLVWNIVYILIFRPVFLNISIFNKYRIFLLNLFGAKIPYTCLIFANAKIWAPWNLQMGNYSVIAAKVNCYNQNKVLIGSNTSISQGAYLCGASHDIEASTHPLVSAPIVIEDQVWIAAESFIMMGVTIGEGAVVGARAAVFKDVEPWTVVGGNPARFIKKREIIC